MKCPLCGKEFFSGDGTCPECGNYISNDNTPRDINNAAAGQFAQGSGYSPQNNIGAGNNFNPGYNYNAPNNFNNYAFQSPQFRAVPQRQVSSGVKAIVIFCVIILIGFFLFYYLYLKQSLTEYDMGSFSISLPVNMKKQSESEFADSFRSAPGFRNSEAGEYHGTNINFGYVVTAPSDVSDGSDTSVFSTSSTQAIIDTLTETYTYISGYDEISHSSDTLKFYMLTDDGEKSYCHFKAAVNNGRAYLLFLVCDSSKESRYSSKFDEWMGSFKAK